MLGIRLLATIATLFLVSCSGLRAHPQRFEYRQILMGVEARIVLYARDDTRARVAASAAFSRIAELDAIMSDYRDDSELNRLTRQPPGTWLAVSDPLWQVLSTAQSIAALSDGAFDVTAGPYVRLWREARRTGTLPDGAALAAAAAASGWQMIELDPTRRTVRLTAPGMQLDLGGIAKGFAADEALRLLRVHGIDRAMIEFGGDIVAGRPPPGSRGWEILLPGADVSPPRLQLSSDALSTSGDAAQFAVVNGVRYSHVIDPRTGIALTDQTTMTVRAPAGLLSDPLATLAAVLGPDSAAHFLHHHFPAANLVSTDSGNAWNP